jgi:polysaccharide biosynthesis/export protein
MRTFLLLFFGCISFQTSLQAQTAQDVAAAAKAQNITSRAQVLEELSKRGISESQARQMARIRGINYDDFLATYFPPSSGNAMANAVSASPVATALTVSEQPLVATTILEPSSEQDNAKVSSRFFGYDIFNNNPFAQKDYLVGNIDEGYIIAPGDELRIIVFGNSTYEAEVQVDLNGNITLPQIGVVMVAGSSFASLKDRLTTYIGKYIESLITNPQSSFIDVSLTQIRPVKITVLGESNTPGPHLISGFASVLNALYSSGGIKSSGSLRSIQVFRNNKLLKTIDLYNYITTGNLDSDIRLTNNDIVFIPQRLSSVELLGSVKKAAIYELKKGEGIADLIRFSGGLPASTSLENVNITRIKPFEDRSQEQIYNRFLTSLNLGQYLQSNQEFVLIDGDKVSFNSILDRVLNQVTIQGNVYKPGTYSIEQYADLKSLILKAAKDLKPNTYFGKVDVFRESEQGDLLFKTYNLTRVLEGEETVMLEDQDQIRIYSEEEVQGVDKVSITGFVEEPLEVFWRENLSLFDLIFQATDFEKETYLAQLLDTRLDVFRFNPSTGLYQINTYQLLDVETLKAIFLQPRDIVKLYSLGVNEVVSPQVTIGGYTNNSASVALRERMTLEDAILAVGGFSEYADRAIAVVNREKFEVNTSRVTERFEVPIDLDYILGLKKQPSNPFYLQNNDIVSIRKEAGVSDKVTIAVSGEVIYPGNITLEYELNTFDEILSRVGGLKPTANLDASYVVRGGQILYVDLTRNTNKDFIQDGDRLVVKDNNGVVSVDGAVNNESTLIFEPGRRAKFYLRKSGGIVRSEAEDKFIVLPNGRSERVGFMKNPKVLPDSRVVVTRKVPKVKEGSNTDRFMDQFIRIFSVTTGAFTTILLTQRL